MKTQAKEELLTTIQSIEAEPGQRLLVVSDIHGHLNRLIRLLEKMNYGGDDILIIVGDLIDKGPESLGVVRYVMDLCRQYSVYVSMGNVEQYRLQLLQDALAAECGKGRMGELLEYLRWAAGSWGGGLLQDMLGELGVPVSELTAENITEHMGRLWEQFREELDFLWSCPTILTAGDYLFVHGGVPTDDLSVLAGSPAVPYLKNDGFWNQGYSFSRYTVVTGHWPAFLYRPDEENGSPLFDRERRILCIDGGCGLKYAGQLNGVMIPDCTAGIDHISWTACDDFPVVTALEPQAARAAGIHIQYFDNIVELVQETEDMAKVCQVSTGKEFEAPKNFLTHWYQDERLRCSDYCDALLEVAPGEKLSLILKAGGKYYVKNRLGKIGWYEGTLENFFHSLPSIEVW
ncbi:MAG: metallophosphoesterase [Firmicutes bacterium]|nr:metallophosphoesterase [Bacillota bacterium]